MNQSLNDHQPPLPPVLSAMDKRARGGNPLTIESSKADGMAYFNKKTSVPPMTPDDARF